MQKFEIYDSQENNYLVVGYRSQVIADLSVSIMILFVTDFIDVADDYGYYENETHTTKSQEIHIAEEFNIDQITDGDGDEVELNSDEKNKIQKEAEEYFKKYFENYEYDVLYYDIHKIGNEKFSKGGIVKLTDFFSNTQRFKDYDGQFLYPPRIEHKLQPSSLDRFDDNNYVGQPKLNGSNTSVAISKSSFVAKERHNKFFANPPKFDFGSLHRGNGFMCLAGEFMNKSKKDQTGKPFRGFCIWDITAYDGKILIGSGIEERMNLLNTLYPSKVAIKTNDGIEYLFKTDVPDIYKVNNFYGNFTQLYDKLSKIDMVEGFVLKRKSGRLEMMLREQNNTGWAVKVRKPTANYKF